MQHQTLRKGGFVKRWHVIPNVNEQTVATHSWGVACIIFELWPDCSSNLIRAALLHDVAEQVTGDVPATAKWANSDLAEELEKAEENFWESSEIPFPKLTEEESTRLKIADMLELLWYCIDEQKLGNKHFKEVFRRGTKSMERFNLEPLPRTMLNTLIQVEANI